MRVMAFPIKCGQLMLFLATCFMCEKKMMLMLSIKCVLRCATMCISLVRIPFKSKSMVYGHVYKYMYDGSTQ